jgi:hypothetical protein
MPTLTSSAETFATGVATGTGLNPDVVRAWVANESAWGRGNRAGQYEGGGSRAFNFLNYGICDGCDDQRFGSITDAIRTVVAQLKRRRDYYGGVLASVNGTPADQISAIAASPWASGHYGGEGGPALVSAYKALTGSDPAKNGGGLLDSVVGAIPGVGLLDDVADLAKPGDSGFLGIPGAIADFEQNLVKGLITVTLNVALLGTAVALVVYGSVLIFRPEVAELRKGASTIGTAAAAAAVV